MSSQYENRGVFQTSPLMILLSYTLLCCGLIAETILMSWELWVIPLLVTAMLVCWGMHITQFLSERVRIWIYALLILASFFFYGIHITSTYDMGFLMIIIVLIFTTTGETGLIYLCQITYYITLFYDIMIMNSEGQKWDNLMVSRSILHVGLMFLAGWLARFIIKRWSVIFGKSGERIAELNESTKRMNSFMANLSHELRTPINAILGITNVMLDKEDSKELRDDMNEVLIAGNRMADQVGDILDYSEIEMDSLVVNRSDYMIASVLNDLVSELRPIMPDEIELIIDVDAEIPTVLRGDAIKLRRILYHLINNGLKYTKEGGVYVKLSSIKQEYGINLCIEVTDTGVGMSKDELDRIYNRFYQAQSGREIRSGGLGISMVIVSGFVRAMGGFITINSKPDEGTTVRVSIPEEVIDDGRCMLVNDESKISLGAYLDMSKYSNPNVREFYNKMILSIVQGLRTTMHWVDNEKDLEKLLEKVELTHLFVTEEEYKRSRKYISTLEERMQVVVIAKPSYELPKDSRAQLMIKPFYCIPVVAVLNSERKEADMPEKKLRCDGVKALVVDDEPMNLSVARGIFRRYGMEVKTAASGEESIAMCATEDYDIIFMDHMMPGMDGVEAMKRIRYDGIRNMKNFAIVALTANALSTAKEMFIAEGFDGFVSKPIELAELERVLKNVLPPARISYEDIESEEISSNNKETKTEKSAEKIEEKKEEKAAEPIVQGETSEEALENTSVESSDRASLSAVGIDVKLGLGYCQEDEELYDDLLKQYVSEAEEKKKKLEQFKTDKDMKNYAILVHALKSNSLTIGAKALSEKAKALEMASKADDIEFVEENHEELIREYDKTVEAIAESVN